MTTLNVALVGYGRWGRVLAKVIDAQPRLELVRICHRSAPTTARTTPRLSDVLEDESIDAVVIATPLEARSDIIRLCLEAGKHVMTEKPLGRSRAEAEQLVGAARSSGRTLFTDYVHAYGHAVEYICTEIARLGPLRQIDVTLVQPGPLVRGEGIVSVLGSHAAAILVRLLMCADITADITTTTNVTWGPSQEQPHRWVWMGGIGDGVHLGFTVDLGYPVLDRRIDVVGELATLSADPLQGTVHWLEPAHLGYETRATPTTVDVKAGDDLSRVFDQFVASIRTGERSNERLALTVQTFLEGAA